MGYSTFLKSLYPDSHDVNAEVYNAILGAIGYVLDQYDPYAIGLPSEFSVTTATNSALESNGSDWGVPRRNGESDTAYRARILSMLPIYANGASDWGITATVAPFTGIAPIFLDFGTDGWSPGDSACMDSAMSDFAGLFIIEIQVQNPNNVSYSHYDMESAVKRAKPARSMAIIYHNGTDTSTLGESSNAVITVV